MRGWTGGGAGGVLRKGTTWNERIDIAAKPNATTTAVTRTILRRSVKYVVIASRINTGRGQARMIRSEEHTSELQSLMRNSYAVFCLKKKKKQTYRKTADIYRS